MTAFELHTHLPPLGEHEREETGRVLQGTLVDLVDLALTGKQLHWNIVGPGFRELHLHLDELVDEWRELSDVVAERAIALGYPPDGRVPALAAQSELEPVEPGPTRVPDAVRQLAQRVAEVDARVRERTATLGEVDLASQDVLIETTRALEKQLWMIRSEL